MSSENIYHCMYCNDVFTNGKVLSNHIRWNHSPKKNSIFVLRCSCIICKKETTSQSLSQHLAKHDRENVINSYCLECHSPIYNPSNKFCNQSCSAKFNNRYRDYTNIEKVKYIVTPKPKTFTKISWCVICNTVHTRKGKTCSDNCYRSLLSNSIKLAISNGHNPNNNRGRGKKSYMELSFDTWLKNNYPKLQYHMEYPFKRTDMIKTYFADFYFPSLSLIIELDGSQHKNTIEYDLDRDTYITNKYNINIIRISHEEYKKQSKIGLIMNLLGT